MRVLFVCMGNAARSLMAEAWANHLSDGEHRFFSAGITPAATVSAKAIAAMAERGISMEAAFPKPLSAVEGPFDLVVAVCGKAAAQCPAPPAGADFENWDLPDPTAVRGEPDVVADAFRTTRDEIERRVRALLARLNEGAALKR